MSIKRITTAIFITLLLIFTGISSLNLAYILQSKIPDVPMIKMDTGSRFPIESFVMVTQELSFYETLCDYNKQDCIPTEKILRESMGTGSGVIVGSKNGQSLVLTAGHVCSAQRTGIPITQDIGLQYIMSLESGFGKEAYGTILAIDISNDLCLMIADNDLGPVLTIADKGPLLHEKIYNMSSPFGLALPLAVPIFDGYFVGQVDTIYTFSLPAAPGSSGSPILNKDGEIISIISGAAISFDEFAIGCTTSSIRNFVLATVATL